MNVIEALELGSGHTVEVTLDEAEPSVDNLEISWTGVADACDSAVLEVIVIPESGNQIRRHVYSDCNSTPGDNYSPTDGFSGGNYTVTVGVDPANDLSVRIKPLVTNTQVSVKGVGGNLGTQVYQVRTTTTLEDGTTRAVRVNKLALTAPSIFDYVLFSGNALEKTP